MILIGSAAMRHYFPLFKRDAKDFDYIVEEGETVNKEALEKRLGKRVELLSNPVLSERNVGIGNTILPLNSLYTLKISHLLGWDINWEKHMFDAQYMRTMGCKLDECLLWELYGYWNAIHGKNVRSDLEMTAEQFFNNAMKNSGLHDTLHTFLNPIPTYTRVLRDGAEVEVCKRKFDALRLEEKWDLVREEVEVMAWERYRKDDYRIAYSKMLKKFILSHAPLWEAVFIIENYITLHRPTRDYFRMIEDGLSNLIYDTKGINSIATEA